MITHEELHTRFRYDPETGLFSRRLKITGAWVPCATAPIKSGKAAGYVQIKINGREYLAHRLAWLYETGEFPKGSLDHINRDRADNRIANLREASARQNAVNSGLPAHNTSGFKGVSWRKHAKKWCADIAILDRSFHLGSFDTPEEAAAEYDRFAKHLHGDFYYKAEQI